VTSRLPPLRASHWFPPAEGGFISCIFRGRYNPGSGVRFESRHVPRAYHAEFPCVVEFAVRSLIDECEVNALRLCLLGTCWGWETTPRLNMEKKEVLGLFVLICWLRREKIPSRSFRRPRRRVLVRTQMGLGWHHLTLAGQDQDST